MADDHWEGWFHSWLDTGTFAHPDSSAGGSGPGYSRPPAPLGLDPWPSSVPHPDSPAGQHYSWNPPWLVVEQRAKAVYDAVTLAPRYVPRALYETTGEELHSMVSGIIPGLLMVLGVLAGSTAFGALAGAAIGALAFGAGAVPGAAIGGELGFDAGVALLEYLGLTILVAYIGKSLWNAATVAGDAVQTAWRSVDNGRTQQVAIDHAANMLAFAVGLVFRGVLQGIVQFLLAKGTAAAASRVPELVGELRRSKLGGAFAEWVARNWQTLIKNPKLQPEKGTGPRRGGGTVNGTGAASGSSGARVAGAGERPANGTTTSPPAPPPSQEEFPLPPKQEVAQTPQRFKPPNAGELASTEINGIKPVRVLPGANGKVAVTGRNMETVRAYGKGLQAQGYDVELFDGDTIPQSARDEWKGLVEQAKSEGRRLTPDEIMNSEMYQANKDWAQELVSQGYTVTDLGAPPGASKSPFYEMENVTIFGGSGK